MMSYLPYIVLIFRRQRSCYHFILLSSFALGRKEKICPSPLQKNAPYRTQRICFGKLRKRLTTIFSKAYFKLFFFNSLVRKFVALCDVFKWTNARRRKMRFSSPFPRNSPPGIVLSPEKPAFL